MLKDQSVTHNGKMQLQTLSTRTFQVEWHKIPCHTENSQVNIAG